MDSSRARLFGGDTALYGDTTAVHRGFQANYPASMPKYSVGNERQDSEKTGFKLFLPIERLINEFPEDRDILIPLVGSVGYINLVATQVQEQFQERSETRYLLNGSYVTYYYGMTAPTLNITGIVPNDFQDDARNKLLRLYCRYLRGSRLSELSSQMVIHYSDLSIIGECQSLVTGLTSAGENYGSFSMTIVVHQVRLLTAPARTNEKFVARAEDKDSQTELQAARREELRKFGELTEESLRRLQFSVISTATNIMSDLEGQMLTLWENLAAPESKDAVKKIAGGLASRAALLKEDALRELFRSEEQRITPVAEAERLRRIVRNALDDTVHHEGSSYNDEYYRVGTPPPPRPSVRNISVPSASPGINFGSRQ